MMPFILAESCGRWGCSWWEGIISVILLSFAKSPGSLLILFGGIVALLLVSIEFIDKLIEVIINSIKSQDNLINEVVVHAINKAEVQPPKKRIPRVGGFLMNRAVVLARRVNDRGRTQQEQTSSVKSKLIDRAKIFSYRKLLTTKAVSIKCLNKQIMKIPQLDLANLELPINFKDGNIEIGIAESYLANPINTHICRQYEGIIRDSDLEEIELQDLKFYFRDGGFAIKGNVQVQMRKLLYEAPVVGAVYTPWVTVAGNFVEELAVDVVERKLNVSHSQLSLSTDDIWYKSIFVQFVLPYLEKEVVKRLNEQLAEINGMTIEELALKYAREKLSQRFGASLFGKNRVESVLKLANFGANRFERLRRLKNKFDSVGVDARVSEEYLWLSMVLPQDET